jgi:hypothetical protein
MADITSTAPVRIKAQWHPFPATAPKDRPILVRGRWRPFDILPGGETCIEIASWSTIMSDGSGWQWMVGLSDMDRWNVDFDEWTDLPQ